MSESSDELSLSLAKDTISSPSSSSSLLSSWSGGLVESATISCREAGSTGPVDQTGSKKSLRITILLPTAKHWSGLVDWVKEKKAGQLTQLWSVLVNN